VVSTAVFAGCEAFTAGLGTIGCAAAAGAAGSLVEQGFKCAENGGGDCSAGAFGESALEGAVSGAVGGALGSLGGKLLAKVAPKAMKVVGGLFGKGATEAGDSAAADATDEAASAAEAEGAGTKSQSESGGSCKIPGAKAPTHSFTGSTRVLMADGSTKAIDQVRVGDTIANSVPGVAGVQAHKVTAVIVTHTDHDFVDVGIKKATESAAVRTEKGGAKSLARKVVRKAAFGLAASAAVLGALAASHGYGQEPATAPVAAVSTTSAQDTKAVAGAEDVQGAHLTTTFHHPFYDVTQSAFVEARDLHAGDVLQTPTGTAEVGGVRLYHANTTTYDLTIGTLHTYYVEAGATPVLVHNIDEECPTGAVNELYGHEGMSKGAFEFRMKIKNFSAGRNVAVAKMEDGQFVGAISKGAEDHAEVGLPDAISKAGYGQGDVAGIYSERAPCGDWSANCDAFVKSEFPGVPVSHSVAWTEDAQVRKDSNAILKDLITGAMRRRGII
jgi:hypothetical protein